MRSTATAGVGRGWMLADDGRRQGRRPRKGVDFSANAQASRRRRPRGRPCIRLTRRRFFALRLAFKRFVLPRRFTRLVFIAIFSPHACNPESLTGAKERAAYAILSHKQVKPHEKTPWAEASGVNSVHDPATPVANPEKNRQFARKRSCIHRVIG